MNSGGSLLRVLKEFHNLPVSEQDLLLNDLYNFSGETKLLMTNRLIGHADFSNLIGRMKHETIDKVYRKGLPAEPDEQTIEPILSAAKKAQAPVEVMLVLEKLAYRGYIEFLDEYGGGPDSFFELGPKHLEAYLTLAKENLPKEKQATVFEEVGKYLLKKDNMITDYIDEVFEDLVGIKIR